MDISRKELEQRYAAVNDEALLDRYTSGTLTELAMGVVTDELRRRGIALPKTARAEPELADAPPVGTGPLVSIASQLTFTEAHVLASLLRSEGIAVELGDAHLATAQNFLSAATGGVRLLVQASNVPRVGEVIAALKRGDYALDDSSDVSSERTDP